MTDRVELGKKIIGLEPHTHGITPHARQQFHAHQTPKRYIATHKLWRYLPNGKLEVTRAGQRCDWVAVAKTYIQLGWAREI